MPIKIPKPSTASYNKTQTPQKKLITIKKKKKQAPKPFIDRISLILDIGDKAEAEGIHANIGAQFDDTQTFQSAKGGGAYQMARRLCLPSATKAKHYPLIQYRHYQKLAVQFRLTFSPVDLDLSCMTEMHVLLTSLLEGGWCAFIEKARITMIEVSVDLDGVPISEVHPLPKQTTTAKVYSNNGHLQTLYLGKKKGNQYRIYDRAEKRNAKKQGWSSGECTRVERVERGKSIKPLELKQMPNPFLGLSFVDLPQSPPQGKQNEYVWPLFCDSVQQRTLPVALKLLPATTKRKEFRSWLSQHPKPWWDPDAIWDQWPKMLDDTKFLDVSYWDK